MQQPMQNTKDTSDPTTAMYTALDRLAKALKLNETIPTTNNQRSSSNPCNTQIAQPSMNTSQDIQMLMVDDNVGNRFTQNAGKSVGIQSGQNAVQKVGKTDGISVDTGIANQYGNGNVVSARAEDTSMIQIAQKEEAGIQLTQEEFDFMADACACEETESVQMNCTSEDTLQQASTSVTQSDNAPVYDSDGSAEEKEYAYNDMQQKIERLQAQLGDLKGKSSDTQCASNTLDPVSQKLKDENVSLESQVLNYAKENAHLKTTYKNLFDSIKVTQAKTNSIINSLQKQLYDTIYENAKLRAQLFDKVSEPKDTTKGTRTNTMFTKQSILGKPPSSSSGSKLYSVSPFPKSSVLPKVDKTNALSKPVTSNSAPSTREPKVVVNNTAKTRRPHPRSISNTDRVTSMSKSSCLSNNIEKIEENHRKSQIPKNQKHMSSECDNITLAIRNAKSEIVYVMCKQCLVTVNHDVCVRDYVNNMNSRADNQSANVTIRENQKKHKANAKKSKELGSKGSLASSRPSKPRTCLRWIPTGRIFAMYGKLNASSNTENKSEKSVCDNASTSNPSKPSSKGFSNSASFLGRLSRLRKHHTSIYPIVVL
ncbi:hypothetical protein Tco_1037214 [Tanacetum coccineum]